MAWTRDVSFNHSYEGILLKLYAEDPMAFRGAVRTRSGVVGKTHKFDLLGGVNMVSVTSRHQDTVFTPLTHTARRANLSDKALGELLDKLDDVKSIISPQNEYTQRFTESYHREVARFIINAANGNASAVGADDVITSVALPSSQQIANGGSGLTMAKLRQTNRILSNAGVPLTDRYFATSPFGIEDLLADSTVTSSDFSTLNALMNGTIPAGSRWMGFNWLIVSDADPDATASAAPATPILPKSSNIRSCFAWHKQALGLAIAKDLTVEIDPRPDKMNSTQVLVQVCLGAVRIQDFGVVKVDFDESV